MTQESSDIQTIYIPVPAEEIAEYPDLSTGNVWIYSSNMNYDSTLFDLGGDTITLSGLDDLYIEDVVTNISLKVAGEEMIRIEPDGFYVRGVKVPQDEKEAKAVYEAFRQWQTQEILTRLNNFIII